MTRAPASRLAQVLGCVTALALGASVRAQGPDPFYASLLRDGELLADQGKPAEAARSLRVACFGMLDEPDTLARCLVRLGLAQSATGDANGFRETFSRLLELEARAPAYKATPVPPAVRSAFEQQVAQRIPAATLAASPTFQGLTTNSGRPTKKGRHADAKPAPEPTAPPATEAPRVSAAPQPAVKVGGTQPSTPSERPAPAASAPTGASPSVAPTPAAAPAPPPAKVAPAPTAPAVLTADERAALTSARTRMLAAKVTDDLRAAGAEASRIADLHPASIEANALAGEIAYRSSRWPAAVLYLRRSGPPADQPLLGFYLAVSLYETGDRAAAAATLRPLLGKLQHTAYVQAYVQKILPS